MTLMDDLLGDSSPFEDEQVAQSAPRNLLDGLEIPSREPSESGDGEDDEGANPADDIANEDGLNQNGRRRRDDSEPDPEEESRISWRSFMESVMDNLNIQGPARERGREFANLTLEEQVMQWYGLQLSQESQVDNLAATNFIRTEVFETHVLFRCRAALLAPWLSNYVTILQEWLLNDMLQRPEAWRMQSDVTGVAEQWQQFSSERKVRATQIRSQNKTLMYRLRTQEADINIIAAKLAPRGMVIREHHRARLAWIMLMITEFEEKVQKGEQKTSSFWDWIGQQVVSLRARVATDPKHKTDQERRTAFTNVFTRALARHRTQYPPAGPPPPPKPRPAWQETLEDAMKLGSVI